MYSICVFAFHFHPIIDYQLKWRKTIEFVHVSISVIYLTLREMLLGLGWKMMVFLFDDAYSLGRP